MLNEEEALLIIFIRNPVLGKVKTRLAATVGPEKALEIYQRLLEHTLRMTRPLKTGKVVYYSDFIPETDAWKQQGYRQKLQQGGDLGARMLDAFREGFTAGYRRICIIGSDCFELSEDILETAFEILNDTALVIGPAADGGYYLLGMRSLNKRLFQDKKWSTDTVFADTLEDLEKDGTAYRLLPVLNDVDEEKDLPL